MTTLAIVLDAPGSLALRRLSLTPMGREDVRVAVTHSAISTGTERLLWTGRMPAFPGMGYPLVPGYESVGRVIDAGADAQARVGEMVFVPGANCYEGARGLFGGSASTVVLPSRRATTVDAALGADAVLLALAATARHAIAGAAPELVIGHGVLGRLIARVAIAEGAAAPVVWETNAARRSGAIGYDVIDPAADERRDYRVIVDASGAAGIADIAISRLARGGELVLAGFYEAAVSFAFPPAFLREARLRVAAEWQPDDLAAVNAMVADGRLSLAGLITHRASAADAGVAYPQAFGDAACLKMILDWSGVA